MPEITVTQEVCEHCGQAVEVDTEYRSIDSGGTACETCADEHYLVCDFCDMVSESLSETDRGDTICGRCVVYHGYRACDGTFCSQVSDRLRTTEFDSELCRDCRRDYDECAGCDVLIYSDAEYCGDCEESRTHSAVIRNWDYRPPQFMFCGAGPTFLGMELEIECGLSTVHLSEFAEFACEKLGDIAYLKSDGSINYGFEIVTHPMSYAWAMESFPWEALGAFRQLGAHGDDTGLHVHVSRSAFASAAHVFRWMKFFYRNTTNVERIARRSQNHWARFARDDRRNIKHYAKGAKGEGRYRAINTQNDDTFEIRVFRASLEPQEVQAALALADASVNYTRELTVADIAQRGGWNWSAFGEWLEDRDEYAPLSAEIALRCPSLVGGDL